MKDQNGQDLKPGNFVKMGNDIVRLSRVDPDGLGFSLNGKIGYTSSNVNVILLTDEQLAARLAWLEEQCPDLEEQQDDLPVSSSLAEDIANDNLPF